MCPRQRVKQIIGVALAVSQQAADYSVAVMAVMLLVASFLLVSRILAMMRRPAFTDGADGADFARGARAAPDAQVLPGISVVVPPFGIALRGDLTPGFSGPLSASCLSNPSLGPLLTCGPFRTRCSRARSVDAFA